MSTVHARTIWLRAQALYEKAPFGDGPEATPRVVEHLGYVQVDTINVVERSHHHILATRIPGYKRASLEAAQSTQKSVFEYWAHALAYIPATDYRYFVPTMNSYRDNPHKTFSGIDSGEYSNLLRRIRDDGPLSIRDLDDEILVEKVKPWGSRKPSRKLLRYGFFVGDLAISKRDGMVKTYDLSDRHFGWPQKPKPVTEEQNAEYLLRRALRSQGIVSLDSICYGNAGAKNSVRGLIESLVRRGDLLPIHIENFPKLQHWVEPSVLGHTESNGAEPRVHILSPFDPLVIQRKRLALFFGYEHRFEAYLPEAKRLYGYFALPVLVGNEIVAAIDLKADRRGKRLLIQKWTWLVKQRAGLKAAIESGLEEFAQFQFS